MMLNAEKQQNTHIESLNHDLKSSVYATLLARTNYL